MQKILTPAATHLVIIVAITISQSGCGNSTSIGPVVVNRWVGLATAEVVDATDYAASASISGQAPITVVAQFIVNRGPADIALNQSEWLTKAEIAWDGMSWVDCTAEYEALLVSQSTEGSAEKMAIAPRHTYTSPGEFRIRCRVTWWDGEVTYNVEPLSTVVTVLAPDEN
jgi:hypothetical protein